MVGEWVIAWVNDLREEYKKEKKKEAREGGFRWVDMEAPTDSDSTLGGGGSSDDDTPATAVCLRQIDRLSSTGSERKSRRPMRSEHELRRQRRTLERQLPVAAANIAEEKRPKPSKTRPHCAKNSSTSSSDEDSSSHQSTIKKAPKHKSMTSQRVVTAQVELEPRATRARSESVTSSLRREGSDETDASDREQDATQFGKYRQYQS